MSDIVALYVETGGCYFGLEGVDPWDAQRDARLYYGPYPVVAHPPCQRWGNLAYANYGRYKTAHNLPGNDGGCFNHSLWCVRSFGGVLEHPAYTHAWDFYGLTKPIGIGWQRADDGGWVCEVWQSAYGHRAKKATWLYFVGVRKPMDLIWGRRPGTHQVGFPDKRGKARNKTTLSKKEANSTPLAFRDALIEMARSSR